MIEVNVVNTSPESLPQYQTDGAVGLDLRSTQEVYLSPGQTCAIPTGLYVEIPDGYELQIRSRSGAVLKQGLMVANAPGTVDPDFRGEVKVILHNIGKDVQAIHPGDRIAQAVLAKVEKLRWCPVNQLSPTQRGTGGFGSTGT